MTDDTESRIKRAQQDLAGLKGDVAATNQSIGALQHDVMMHEKQLLVLSFGIAVLCGLLLIQAGVFDRE